MKRIDTDESEQYWKICIYGPSGSGKSALGATAPKPLILLSERQGMQSVRQTAKRLGVRTPPVLFVEDLEDCRAIIRAFHGPKDQPFRVFQGKELALELAVEDWPQTLVADSITDICDLIVADIRSIAPPRPGKDGLPVDSQRFWGTLIDKTTGLVKAFRDLPVNVVFLALPNEKTREDGDGNTIERLLSPKLATANLSQVMAQAVNVLGWSYKTTDEGKFVFGVDLWGRDGMLTKTCPPLKRREVADLSSWIARLNGHLEDVPRMPAPYEGAVLDPAEDGEVSSDNPASNEAEKPPPMCTECSEMPVAEDGEICEDCEAKAFALEQEEQPKKKATTRKAKA